MVPSLVCFQHNHLTDNPTSCHEQVLKCTEQLSFYNYAMQGSCKFNKSWLFLFECDKDNIPVLCRTFVRHFSVSAFSLLFQIHNHSLFCAVPTLWNELLKDLWQFTHILSQKSVNPSTPSHLPTVPVSFSISFKTDNWTLQATLSCWFCT